MVALNPETVVVSHQAQRVGDFEEKWVVMVAGVRVDFV